MTGVSSSAGTLTVNVSQSLPNSLVPSGSGGQALPLRLLIDFPVATNTGDAGLNPGTQAKARRRALSLLGLKTVSTHHKAKARSHRTADARTHNRYA